MIAEAALLVAGKLISRSQGIVSPPREIGDWIVSAGDSPISDSQRDNPNQMSVIYTNEDQQLVRVDIAAVQSVDNLRLPQKYLVDSDGRIYQTQLLTHRKRSAYQISAIEGIEKNIICVHWCQKPGGSPVPTAADSSGDALKAILLRRPRFYVCDVWVELRPTTNGQEVRELLQKFADALSEKIKTGL